MIEAKLVPLPHDVKGYVAENCGDYTILLNSRCTREQNMATYLHELEHIENDDFQAAESAGEIENVRHGGNTA